MTIGAIDCGLGGAIAWFNESGMFVKKMPREDMDQKALIDAVFPEGSEVWIETQSMRSGDSVSGKFFNTSKLVVNYKQLLFMLKMQNVKIVEVTAHTWQKKYDLPLDYNDKKKALAKIAQVQFPKMKPTLATCDALLILHHARLMNQYKK